VALLLVAILVIRAFEINEANEDLKAFFARANTSRKVSQKEQNFFYRACDRSYRSAAFDEVPSDPLIACRRWPFLFDIAATYTRRSALINRVMTGLNFHVEFSDRNIKKACYKKKPGSACEIRFNRYSDHLKTTHDNF